MKYIICFIVIIMTAYYMSLLVMPINYNECDQEMINYELNNNSKVQITTPMERKCSVNFYTSMKLRSYIFGDNKASFYLYKMSTRFNSDKYYWLYISAQQGNKEAKKIITDGRHLIECNKN